MSIRVRFAPSPTGELHLGGARTALVNALFARAQGGRFVLRIEDTDLERNLESAVASLERDLDWLGIVPDESPHKAGEYGPYRQSQRSNSYRVAFETLRAADRIYPCFCASGAAGERRCPGGCASYSPADRAARLASGALHAFRFLLDEQRGIDDLLHGPVDFTGAPAPDPVVMRADASATFLFANAIDDAEMAISHVIRGDDHLPNAWKQAQILRALGADPPRFAHLPLIHGPDHKPLSKRHGPASVGALRSLGYPAEAVVIALAHLGAQPPEIVAGADPWPPLSAWFRLESLSTAAAIHDQGRLDHFSSMWLRALGPSRVAARARDREDRRELIGDRQDPLWWPALIQLTCESQVTLGAAIALARAMLSFGGGPAGESIKVLEHWRHYWPTEGLQEEQFKALSASVQQASATKGSTLFHPLRVALTGRDDGPALSRLAPLIDQAAREGGALFTVRSCVERIDVAIAQSRA